MIGWASRALKPSPTIPLKPASVEFLAHVWAAASTSGGTPVPNLLSQLAIWTALPAPGPGLMANCRALSAAPLGVLLTYAIIVLRSRFISFRRYWDTSALAAALSISLCSWLPAARAAAAACFVVIPSKALGFLSASSALPEPSMVSGSASVTVPPIGLIAVFASSGAGGGAGGGGGVTVPAAPAA